VAETADWLREILADGPIPSSEIFERGDVEGFSKRTLKRAASKLGIKPAKSGMSGGWSWSLPPKSAKTPEECQEKNLAPFDELGTLRDPQEAEIEL
jgi:putative DNA primase/helicase